MVLVVFVFFLLFSMVLVLIVKVWLVLVVSVVFGFVLLFVLVLVVLVQMRSTLENLNLIYASDVKIGPIYALRMHQQMHQSDPIL